MIATPIAAPTPAPSFLSITPVLVNSQSAGIGLSATLTIKLRNVGKKMLTGAVDENAFRAAPFQVMSGGGAFRLAPNQTRTVALAIATTPLALDIVRQNPLTLAIRNSGPGVLHGDIDATGGRKFTLAPNKRRVVTLTLVPRGFSGFVPVVSDDPSQAGSIVISVAGGGG